MAQMGAASRNKTLPQVFGKDFIAPMHPRFSQEPARKQLSSSLAFLHPLDSQTDGSSLGFARQNGILLNRLPHEESVSRSHRLFQLGFNGPLEDRFSGVDFRWGLDPGSRVGTLVTEQANRTALDRPTG